MADLMQQARELLAAEFAKDWQRGNCKMLADAIINGDELRGYGIPYALAAIAAALRAAPEGPETHYHCADGIHGTLRRLRRYAKQGDNRNSLQGQTMEEAAAFIEHALAARPQGVK